MSKILFNFWPKYCDSYNNVLIQAIIFSNLSAWLLALHNYYDNLYMLSHYFVILIICLIIRTILLWNLLLNLCYFLKSPTTVSCIADIMEPCRYPVFIGVEQEYIPDSSLWSTSNINSQRASKYARLNGWKGKLIFMIAT